MQKKIKLFLAIALTLVAVALLFLARSYLFNLFGIMADVEQKEKELGSKVVANGDFKNDTLQNTEIVGDAIRLKVGSSNESCGNAPENNPDKKPDRGNMKVDILEANPSSSDSNLYAYYVGEDGTLYNDASEITLTETDAGVSSEAPGLKVQRDTGWVYFELDKTKNPDRSNETKTVEGTITFSNVNLKNSSIKNVSGENISDGQKNAQTNNDEISVNADNSTINFFLTTNATDVDAFYVNYCVLGAYNVGGYVDGVIDLQKSSSISKLTIDAVDVNGDTGKMHLVASLSRDGQTWTEDYSARNSTTLVLKPKPMENQFCYRYLKYRIRLSSTNKDIRPGFSKLTVLGGEECKYQPNPEEAITECNDRKDNDGDGKVDFGSDQGCFSLMDNSEKDPEKICEDGTRENMRFKVQFDQVENKGEGNMKKRVYTGTDSNFYKDDEWIDLVTDGVAQKDISLDETIPGVAVQRGDGYIYVSFAGNHKTDQDVEITSGSVIFDKTYITNTINGYTKTGGVERNGPFEKQGDGKYKLGNDEYTVGDSPDGKPGSVSFFSTVDVDEDSFFIYYNYDSKVGGGCQCQDGIDNDGDGLIDYPNDPGCSSPTDNDESNISQAAEITECSDGVDNDGDGFVDFPDDKGCSSLMDDQEIDAQKICQDGTHENIKMKVDFKSVDNSGDGDMKEQVFVGNEVDIYKGGAWIDLVTDGVAKKDGEVEKDKPGIVVQRGEGYFFVSLFGHAKDKQGREAISADISLDNGSIIRTINGRKKVKGESDYDGPFESQGDGVYILGVATQDEYIEGDYIPENPGPSLVSIFSTTTAGADSFYVYYNYTPKVGGGCQCQDGIDNDGDGLIDYPNDPGCDSAIDNDEKDNLEKLITEPGKILPQVIKSGVAFWVLVAIVLAVGGLAVYRIAKSENGPKEIV